MASSAAAAIQAYYDAPIGATQNGDEFVAPTMIAASTKESAGEPGEGRRHGDFLQLSRGQAA